MKYSEHYFVKAWVTLMAVRLCESAATITICSEERTFFFMSLGKRIAASRRANHITQVQLAEAPGMSQHIEAR